MKCPYICTNIQTVQIVYIRDELSDVITAEEHRLVDKKRMQECLKEECAAWSNGRCDCKGGD